MRNRRAFTLIELLVVIAIIGLLSSVVMAALNSARAKGQVAAIKSNLRNMISAQELAYDSVSPNAYPTASTAVSGMLTAITNTGGTAGYYSHDGKRWGASAKLNSDSSKNYSVDSSGVVTWDTADVGGANTWAIASSLCSASGARLPTLEQLKALYNAYSGTPPNLGTNYFWTGTENPSDSSQAYSVSLGPGIVESDPKGSTFRIRCVR